MYEPSVWKILSILEESDQVLDVGGWACPFNRAQWVLDSEPFETRGFYRTFGGPPSQGGEREHFSERTWIRRDICDREPWPFADKQFDFVICSHVLEDVRDPIGVCSELIRVGRRGYVETPSRLLETCRGLEGPRTVGLSHHRWFVDYGATSLTFLMKYHFLHSHFRFSLPASFARRIPEEGRVSWLWWDEEFEFEERIIHGLGNQMSEIAGYVGARYRYSRTRFLADRLEGSVRRALSGVARRLGT